MKGLTEGSYYVQDYLIGEVLSQVPPAFARFLMETSLLDRFCAPLCDVFRVGTTRKTTTEEALSGKMFIEWLEKTHLFVIPLDETHDWFRYHHLFQQLLQHQLKRRSAEEIARLHTRASDWFAEQRLIDEALPHALAAGDTDYAIQLFVQHRDELMNNEQWNRLERWLRLFPNEVIEANPLLLLTHAWLVEHGGDFLEAFTINHQVEAFLPNIPPESLDFGRVHGEYNCLLAEQQYVAVQTDLALTSAEKALKLLPVAASTREHLPSTGIPLSIRRKGNVKKVVTLVNEEIRHR